MRTQPNRETIALANLIANAQARELKAAQQQHLAELTSALAKLLSQIKEQTDAAYNARTKR